MNWPAYRDYSESVIPWAGTLPAEWRTAALQQMFTVTLGKMLQSEPRTSADRACPYLRAAHIQPNGLSFDATEQLMWFSPKELKELSLHSGDVVVVEGGAGYGRSATLRSSLAGWGFQNSINRLRPRDGNSGRFADYCIKAALRNGFIEVVCGVATIPHLTAEKLGQLRIPNPPPDTQNAICEFLDYETAKIDALITKQEQLIATLHERRLTTVDQILEEFGFTIPQSLAELDSATPPIGWRIIHLGTVLRQLTNGFVGPTRDILVDDGVPYIQSTHIKQGRIAFDRRPFYVSQKWHDERPRIHLREGDVLIVQTGDIGKVAVVPPDFGEASCHALQIARVKPEILSGSYLAAFLSSWIGYHYLCSLATGALHPHLEAGIRAMPVVVPPLEIQSMIVRRVSEQTAKIDRLVAKSTEVIDTLQEYRSALITDAVTGKIDVREAVA